MLKMLALFILFGAIAAEDYVHNPIQYHSQSRRGTYNWGYDTGLYGAHQFHQENRDEKGTVRGRYGYTDPDGKLRLTYYTSGAGGYKTWIPSAQKDIGYPLNENGFSRYVESDESSLWRSASKTSQNVYQQQHVQKHEPSQRVKGQNKIDTKGQTIVETKGQTTVETKGGSKGQIYQKKSYFSPAEYYKSYGQQRQQQEILQQQQQQVKHVYNKPEPITPMQYKHIYQPNYAPGGRYSRCYCI